MELLITLELLIVMELLIILELLIVMELLIVITNIVTKIVHVVLLTIGPIPLICRLRLRGTHYSPNTIKH
jgi:hypothetical protein